MLNKLSRFLFPIVVAVAALALPPASLAAGASGNEVTCSTQTESGLQACDDEPTGRSCDEEARDASQPSDAATDIVLENRGDEPVRVYWLNFQGRRVLYDPNLPPGGRQVQRTFVGHNWLVTTMTDQCLGIFRTAPTPAAANGISAPAAPPEIQPEDQPPPPEENLVWTPGYWDWNADAGDYYWAPGSWVAAPIVGYLWTPGYWLVRNRLFVWEAGYWGPHVGFYGGINYGHGYFGRGYVGGTWRDGRMTYNSAVTNVGNFKSNSYREPVSNSGSISRVSFNGSGGISAQPSAPEQSAAREIHIPPTAAQGQQLHTARNNPALRAGAGDGSSKAAPEREGHPGTLSIMHSNPPARPVEAAGSSVSMRPAPVSSTSLSARPPDEPRTPQVRPHITQAPVEQKSAVREIQPTHQNSSQSRPRTVTRVEGHAP